MHFCRSVFPVFLTAWFFSLFGFVLFGPPVAPVCFARSLPGFDFAAYLHSFSFFPIADCQAVCRNSLPCPSIGDIPTASRLRHPAWQNKKKKSHKFRFVHFHRNRHAHDVLYFVCQTVSSSYMTPSCTTTDVDPRKHLGSCIPARFECKMKWRLYSILTSSCHEVASWYFLVWLAVHTSHSARMHVFGPKVLANYRFILILIVSIRKAGHSQGPHKELQILQFAAFWYSSSRESLCFKFSTVLKKNKKHPLQFSSHIKDCYRTLLFFPFRINHSWPPRRKCRNSR